MFSRWQENSFIYFSVHGVITWIIFLVSFLLLTEGFMFVMELQGIAILFIIVGAFCLILNYYNLKKIVYYSPIVSLKVNVPIYNFHQIIISLERILRVIVILTSLGLLSSLSTFIFISMEYFALRSIDAMLSILPFLFIIYLIFVIPSFYGLRELNQIKYFLNEFRNMKIDLKQNLSID
jgi:hypothetical protein